MFRNNSIVLCRFIIHFSYYGEAHCWFYNLEHIEAQWNKIWWTIITLILQRDLMRCHVSSKGEKYWFMNLWEMIHLIHVWWTFVPFDCSKSKNNIYKCKHGTDGHVPLQRYWAIYIQPGTLEGVKLLRFNFKEDRSIEAV